MIWLDTIVQGVLLGGLYALFAAGLSLVFGIMRLVNLEHGDLIVLAAFLILLLVSALGLDPFLAAAVALPVMFALGWGLQFLVLNRTLGDDILPPLLVTFGLSVVIQNGLLEGFSAEEIVESTEDGRIAVNCEFCSKEYEFDPAEFVAAN